MPLTSDIAKKAVDAFIVTKTADANQKPTNAANSGAIIGKSQDNAKHRLAKVANAMQAIASHLVMLKKKFLIEDISIPTKIVQIPAWLCGRTIARKQIITQLTHS